MAKLSRRGFLAGAGSSVLTLGAAPLALPRWRPHDEVRIACVGIRGRGRAHIDGFRRLDGVRVVALVDVDRDVLAREAKRFTERGEKVDTEVDLRRVLDRDDVDAIAVASPNHWHALQAIWACQAGKDVYLEKPVSHNVWEGSRIVAAARKYGRIVQSGTQSRSSHGLAEGIAFVQSGKLGAIRLARGLCYKPRRSIGKVAGPQQVPDAVDYDLWCGPSPKAELRRRNLHYDWHWDFRTGNGDVGNQGIHQMDIARWALGQTTLPRHTLSIGGRVGYDDDGDTPNTQIVYHEFDEGPPLLFEVRGLPRDRAAQQDGWNKQMDAFAGVGIGVVVHCEAGTLRIPDYHRAIALDADGEEVARFEGSSDHLANFIAAVRSRRVEDLAADIREGHVSSAMCHMGNLSHLLGARAGKCELDLAAEKDPHLAEAWRRMHAHLDANGVDVDDADPTCAVRLGPRLSMDPATERFADAASNALLARAYRDGFVVPQDV